MNYLLNHAYPIDKSEPGLSWSKATNRAKSKPRTPIMMTTRGGSMEDKNQKNFPVFRPAYQKHLGQARRRFDDGQLLISEFCRHCDFHPPFLVWWSVERRRRRRIPSSHQPWMRKKKLQLHEVHRIVVHKITLTLLTWLVDWLTGWLATVGIISVSHNCYYQKAPPKWFAEESEQARQTKAAGSVEEPPPPRWFPPSHPKRKQKKPRNWWSLGICAISRHTTAFLCSR